MQEVLAAVQHTSKAGEDQDFLLLFHNQLFDNLVEYNEFSRCMNHMFTDVIRLRLCVRENIWMVAALYQIRSDQPIFIPL